MQNLPGDPRLPGVLGLGQSRATTISNAFLVFGYLTPLPLAIVSDAWIGKYKTLILSLRYGTSPCMLEGGWKLTSIVDFCWEISSFS